MVDASAPSSNIRISLVLFKERLVWKKDEEGRKSWICGGLSTEEKKKTLPLTVGVRSRENGQEHHAARIFLALGDEH
jgi:hypothetical protein